MRFVGSRAANPSRPQVFNIRYMPLEGKREPGDMRHTHPWVVELDCEAVDVFPTHSEAIDYADRIARQQP